MYNQYVTEGVFAEEMHNRSMEIVDVNMVVVEPYKTTAIVAKNNRLSKSSKLLVDLESALI